MALLIGAAVFGACRDVPTVGQRITRPSRPSAATASTGAPVVINPLGYDLSRFPPAPNVTAPPGGFVGCEQYPLFLWPTSATGRQDVAIIAVHGWDSQTTSCDSYYFQQGIPMAVIVPAKGTGLPTRAWSTVGTPSMPGVVYWEHPISIWFPSLAGVGYRIYLFSYPTHRAISTTADQLTAAIVALLVSNPSIHGVVLLGHSMGGDVSWLSASSLEGSAATQGVVRGVVTLGSPLTGTPLPRTAKDLASRSPKTFSVTEAELWAIANLAAPGVFSEGAQSLVSPTMPSSPVPLYAIAGTYGAACSLPGAIAGFLDCAALDRFHSSVCDAPAGCPNDGVVPLASGAPKTRLSQTSDGRDTLPYNHTELLDGRNGNGAVNDRVYMDAATAIAVFARVNRLPVATITATPSSITVMQGAAPVTLGVSLKDRYGSVLTNRTPNFTSSDTKVVSVSGTGTVTFSSPGNAIITIAVGSVSARVTVTVKAPVASVAVTPGSATIAWHQTVQLSATAQDAQGHTVTDRPVQWTSNAPSVVSVSTAGVATGVAYGTATITATSEGRSGTAKITVYPLPVNSIVVSPATLSLSVGQNATLTAEARDATNHALPGRAITWTSNAPSVASVSANGVVKALKRGNATVMAASEGRQASVPVQVK